MTSPAAFSRRRRARQAQSRSLAAAPERIERRRRGSQPRGDRPGPAADRAARARWRRAGDDRSASGKLALREPRRPGRSTRAPAAARSADAAFSTDFHTVSLEQPEGIAARVRRPLEGRGSASRGRPRSSTCACASSTCAACAPTSRAPAWPAARLELEPEAPARAGHAGAGRHEPERRRRAQRRRGRGARAARAGRPAARRAAAAGCALARRPLRGRPQARALRPFALRRLPGRQPQRQRERQRRPRRPRQGSFAWDIAASTLLEQPFASSGRARLAGERIADADAWATLGANRATAKGAVRRHRATACLDPAAARLNALSQRARRRGARARHGQRNVGRA